MSAPAISMPVLMFFRRIVRGYFRRHFHAVRIANGNHFASASGPLIVYANHSSWWDPLVSILLAAELLPARHHFAPMDAAALKRYGILQRVGIFPVETATARGAVQFLRTGEDILHRGGVLWVTPQGRFSDPRERPLVFKPGLAALAARAAPCTVLPLAIEYPFWDERLPECLLRFGTPIPVALGETAHTLQPRLLDALASTMDALRESALRRHPAGFQTLSRGVLGVGGFYALGQRAKAILQHRPYRAEHTLSPADDPLLCKNGGPDA